MATLLLDTLRKAELDQLFIQWHHSIRILGSDYNSLGIVSIQDRKKLFQLVQSLRQELPTKENGLVASSTQSIYRRQSRPTATGITSSPGMSPTTSFQQQQQSSTTSTITRSRSRTLPDQHQRPDFMKTVKSSQQPPSADFFMHHDPSSDEEDEEDMPEIRRSSNPLLNPYGIPIQNNNTKLRSPYAQQQQPQRSPMIPTTTLGNNNNNNTNLGQSDLNQKIRVCVRKRPLNKKELERGEKDISPTAGIRSINVNEPNFTFDDVFDVDDSNDQIYQRTAQPLVKYVFNGGKATCFAYGQTGSGKTYTMLDPQHGLYVLAARDVFALLCQPQYQHLSAYIGFYEIYQGQLYDLLNNRKKLFAREDGKQNVVIVGLKEYVIKNVDDLMKVFEYGSQCRSTGSTGANSDSSRSHAILQVLLKPTKNRKIITGKLSFIDLAGSERGADRGETDVKTRMEGAEINKSLLALKECIRALDQDKRHTPFRQSKLTQVLKDSFVGHSRTCMIATISPNQGNSEHTLNTLRYADRVKELKGERDRRGQSDSNTSSVRMRGNMQEDDPDLYHEDDDDLFLGDEDFPSDGDVHILDEDFPHETTLHDSNNDDDYDSGGPTSSSQQQQKSTASLDSDTPTIDPQAIEQFIKFHRAEIRQTGECSKKETKLLTHFSLNMASRKEMDDDDDTSMDKNKDQLPRQQQDDDMEKTMVDFQGYLNNLDEVLEMKMAAIDALRDRIRVMLGEDDDDAL
ncbi:P-loop containing nucleoside triphosphate hydrolase protein [Halteromyces radiatus]|uniref:P-loop containing nucleoside triphosphate hydrolase protein n=1 Tax=Halteromyces radiatus TaxID=101107 RepID=UPI0022202BC9|nr:P-loop containing nucleoside triphosphate hydrolase protein [Halteromyces radiatus]KAI8089533.1 P-loop containing nucleoside triphosphate hydrolase protein [Halteromyces radiatus]